MDKLKNGRTITIKINGNERTFKEDNQSKSVENQKEIVDSTPANEVDSLSEIAASQQAVDESFDWVLPEENDEIEEYVVAKKPAEKKKNSISVIRNHLQKRQNTGPAKSVFFSIVLAVILGTSFGFLVLKLVITDSHEKEKAVITMPNDTGSDNNTNTTQQSLALQPLNTFIVQGGVFSSADSANIGIDQAKEKGVASQLINSNGKIVLVLGVADSIEKAKAIGTVLKGKGLDVFAKPYSLPEKNVKELTKGEINLLKNFEGVYQSLSSLSSSAILSESIDNDILAKQKNLLGSINKQEIKSKDIRNLLTHLEGTVSALEAYEQQPNEANLTESQQHLLTFMESYFKL